MGFHFTTELEFRNLGEILFCKHLFLRFSLFRELNDAHALFNTTSQPYLKNSLTQTLQIKHSYLKPLNPTLAAKAMNSCWVLSFPAGVWVIIIKSIWEVLFVELLIFGEIGRIALMTIIFPSCGVALWQFFNSFRQCSSSQSWSIYYKINQLWYYLSWIFFFFFCAKHLILKDITVTQKQIQRNHP